VGCLILVLGKHGQLSQEFQAINNEEAIYISSKELDVRKIDLIYPLLKRYSPKILINFTAYNFVDQAEVEKNNVLINSLAIREMAKYCAANKIMLIHISSDYVFDGFKGQYEETDTPNPINAYGRAKLDGENHITRTCKKYLILRTSWLYSLYGNNFLTKVMAMQESAESLKGADDLIGSPTSAKSLAHAVHHIIHLSKEGQINYGTYHFSNKGEVSKYVFMKKILEELSIIKGGDPKNISKAKNADFKMSAKRPYNTSLKSNKFSENFEYKIPLWDQELKLIMEQI
jgi:dTDP-4-dehydrorhamnose reductase